MNCINSVLFVKIVFYSKYFLQIDFMPLKVQHIKILSSVFLSNQLNKKELLIWNM